MEQAKAIQNKLDDLQQEMHAKVEACDWKCNQEKNAVFAARRAAIADLIAKKELPANFWAAALINLLQEKDRESPTMPHFLGPYDQALLEQYLEDVQVEYTQQGHRVEFHFKPNPYFEETRLWADAADMMDEPEMDEEDEMPPPEESWEFSGVTWKDGCGPQSEDDEEEEGEEEDADGESAPGQKRQRASSSSNGTNGKESSMQGPSVLEVFTSLPPHPEEDESYDDDDDSVVEEAVQAWEAEMEDRKMLLRLVEHFVHANPIACLQAAATATEDGESAAKKPKAE